MCKVKPPIAERHDVVVWEEMEIINKVNYFLSYPIPFWGQNNKINKNNGKTISEPNL